MKKRKPFRFILLFFLLHSRNRLVVVGVVAQGQRVVVVVALDLRSLFLAAPMRLRWSWTGDGGLLATVLQGSVHGRGRGMDGIVVVVGMLRLQEVYPMTRRRRR